MTPADYLRLAGYLPIGELAERLSLTPSTVRRWVAAGLPCERLGRLVWVRPADLRGRPGIPDAVVDAIEAGR